MQERTPHYTVLARRFRPQTFDEVVGQQHISQALKNAIEQGRVAHAYLFTGARGVGKTSMARIFAKVLNCSNRQGGDPCNACEICRGISEGNDIDVAEIDGASNRGIDDVRTLRANVSVRSMRTGYKVYIIDEVHMLTKDAFNALLKTLEEPPPNVKFVFCTTEPNKIPDTILSRCQRFDFSAIETADIIRRLQQIAEAEDCEADRAALELLARRAAGSMRDSQSLLDQLLAFAEDRLTVDEVHRLLGTASDERLFEIADALIARQQQVALELLDRALAEGVQLSELIDQLLYYLRDLMVVASGADEIAFLAAAADDRQKLSGQAEQWGLRTILAAMQILAEAKTRMFRASHARALAEMALVRIALLEELRPLEELLDELTTGGDAKSPAGSRGERRSTTVAGAGTSRSSSGANAAPSGRQPPPKKKPDDAEPSDEAVATAEPSQEQNALASGTEDGLWSQLLDSTNDMTGDHLRAVTRVAISGPNQLDANFPASYHFSKQYCERPEVLARLERRLSELTGGPVRLRFQLEQGPAQGQQEEPLPATRDDGPVESKDDEFLQEAKSIFSATVIQVDDMSSPANPEG